MKQRKVIKFSCLSVALAIAASSLPVYGISRKHSFQLYIHSNNLFQSNFFFQQKNNIEPSNNSLSNEYIAQLSYPGIRTSVKSDTVEIEIINLDEKIKIQKSFLSNDFKRWIGILNLDTSKENNFSPTILSLNEVGINSIQLYKDPSTKLLNLKVIADEEFKLDKPVLEYRNNKIKIIFRSPINKSITNQLVNKKGEQNLLNTSKQEINNIESILINTKGYVKVNGPDVSLTLKDADPKDVLMSLAKLGEYGFIFVPSESNESFSNNNEETKITLTFKDESYERALNSVLLASGFQGKKEGNLILVGKNILGKSFGPQISKVYRLKQTSASSAADYLASLGATMSKVDIKSPVSDGMPIQDGISKSSSDEKNIQSYGALEGPLKGLNGTTDSRLNTITIIGDHNLIGLAEKYLQQLDLRHKQVALSVKIIDVVSSNNSDNSNSLAYKLKNTYLLNSEGLASFVFGGNIEGVTTEAVGSRDSSSIADREFLSWFKASLVSKDAKILASPTLIMGENQEELVGGMQVADANSSLANSSIGRPYANESFITVGTKVITNYSVQQGDSGPPVCEPEFGNAGLTFGAKVHKIDDNGYVTFSISPELSSVTETTKVTDACGLVSVLSVRRLDTGTVRVKDGQTLILSGVLKEDNAETIKKWPIIGDIPLLGRLFRSGVTQKANSELIIMVSPKVINDDPYYKEYDSDLINQEKKIN